jgi:insertion element IS1 protein InsB
VPEVTHPIIAMRLNASGGRDTARVLHLRTDPVRNDLRQQEAALESVNTALRHPLNPDDMAVDVARAGEAAMDERWSVGGTKKAPRGLWHAMDHGTGAVVAYVFGRRTDEGLLPLTGLREPVKLTRCDTDSWGAYTRHLDPAAHKPGKHNTQTIARQHLT